MGVDARGRAVAADDLEEALDEVAQALGRDRRVLDEGERLVVVLHRHREPQAGLAYAPDPRLRGQVRGVKIAVAVARRAQIALERLEARRQVARLVAVELDAEQRARVAFDERAALALELRVL